MAATKARTNWLSDPAAAVGDSQTTGQGLAVVASTSATVFPKPAGAQTRVNGPASPSRMSVVSRGRAITSEETRGRWSGGDPLTLAKENPRPGTGTENANTPGSGAAAGGLSPAAPASFTNKYH